MLVRTTRENAVATIELNDPERRNALSLAMFDALEEALAALAGNDAIQVVLLRGAGKVFCAGFDLAAVANDPPLMATYIGRLSAVTRALRRLPQVVVAAVHGGAIAGGCALVSACDLVIVAPGATLGYPVHRLGVSPAVTIPTLAQAVGHGAARALLMSGELLDGRQAHRHRLASHLSAADDSLGDEAIMLCRRLAGHGLRALRATKRWLNELDGSLDEARFDAPAEGSGALAGRTEAIDMLRTFWAGRR